MPKHSIKEFINAPIDRVFDKATDFENCAEFVEGIKKVEMLSEGHVGVGTRFRETRIMFKKEAVEEMEVTEFERPKRYVLEAENHGCKYFSTFRFTERDGGTEVEMVFDAVPQTTMAKIMGFLMKPMMGMIMKECSKDLTDIKNAVEGESAATNP